MRASQSGELDGRAAIARSASYTTAVNSFTRLLARFPRKQYGLPQTGEPEHVRPGLGDMPSRRNSTNKRPNARQGQSLRVRSLRQLCAELSPEDGVDPKLLARSGESTDRRKTWQLCSQVHDALRLILGEAADERLQALEVREVLPAPNDAQLLVLLVPLDPLTAEDALETERALQLAAGWLRTEIAGSITRKRAPRLVLQLVPR
jgi:hypothetical protein